MSTSDRCSIIAAQGRQVISF